MLTPIFYENKKTAIKMTIHIGMHVSINDSQHFINYVSILDKVDIKDFGKGSQN